MEKLKDIAGHPGFFMTNRGAIYKILTSGSQKKIHPIRTKKGYMVQLNPEVSERHLVLNLILETFYPDWNGLDRVTFKERDNTIDPMSLKFIPSTVLINLTIEENKIYNDFKCKSRADSSNQRCSNKITGYDVLNTILRHNKKCHYCQELIKPSSWHLDHFYPLSTGGKNTIDNIVPACKRCNIMKNDLNGYAFIQRCKLLTDLNSDYENKPVINQGEYVIAPRIFKIEKKLIHQIKMFRDFDKKAKDKAEKTKEILKYTYKFENL